MSHFGDDCPGVGDAGEAGFGEEADVLAAVDGVEVVTDGVERGVLVEFEEEGVVEGVRVAGFFEEASGCADFFDDEGAAGGEEEEVE